MFFTIFFNGLVDSITLILREVALFQSIVHELKAILCNRYLNSEIKTMLFRQQSRNIINVSLCLCLRVYFINTKFAHSKHMGK